MKPSLSGPAEPLPSDVVLCSYPDTMDGAAAAWLFYKVARRDNIPVEFVNTAQSSPWSPKPSDILERNWVSIGDAPVGTFGKGLLSIARMEPKLAVPLPYAYWKRTVPFGIERMSTIGKSCGVHDSKKSLCMMAWEFFFADRAGFDKPPRIISHIDDHITETWRYNDSKYIAAAISSYPHELAIYDQLATACEDRRRREAMIAGGQGILRYIEQNKEKFKI